METGYIQSDAYGMKSKLSILEGEDYDDRLQMDRRKINNMMKNQLIWLNAKQMKNRRMGASCWWIMG